MSEGQKKETDNRLWFFFCLLFAAPVFALWVYFQFRYSINADNAVLIEFARRMMEGGKTGVDFFEINPPLGVLLYIPVVLLDKAFGIPVYHGVIAFALSLVLLSAGLCWRLLLRLPFLARDDAHALAFIFLFAALFVPHIHFGQRDHIIILGLMPLVLAQFALNENLPLPKPLLYAALVFGAFAALIRPHYGLAPALMILWRFGSVKSFRILRDPDFLVLAAATLAYGLALLTVFSAYIDDVLPTVLGLYLRRQATLPAVAGVALPALSLTAVFLLTGAAALKDTRRRFIMALAVPALTGVIVAVIQFKGLYYHLIPAFVAAALLGAAVMALLLPQLPPKAKAGLAALAVAALMIAFPVKRDWTTHADYRALPLSGLLDEKCARPCNFLILNDFAFMNQETALYTGSFHASRFMSFWFLPPLLCESGMEPLAEAYARMVGEDLARWKPSLVLISRAPERCPDGREIPIDFGGFFSRDETFAREWSRYRPDGVLEFDRAAYFRGYGQPMAFDIYRRGPE